MYCSIYPLHLAWHTHTPGWQQGSLLTIVTIDHQPPGDVTGVTCPRVPPDSLTSLQNHFVPPPGLGSGVSVRCRSKSRSRSLGSGQLIGAVTLALVGDNFGYNHGTDNFNWQSFPELYFTFHCSQSRSLDPEKRTLFVFWIERKIWTAAGILSIHLLDTCWLKSSWLDVRCPWSFYAARSVILLSRLRCGTCAAWVRRSEPTFRQLSDGVTHFITDNCLMRLEKNTCWINEYSSCP